MSSGVKLPPGFQLVDEPKHSPGAVSLPPGFELVRTPEQAGGGFLDTLARGARFVDGTVRMLANGITLGAMDEIASGLDTATGRASSYDEALAANRGRDAAFEAEHPIVSTGAKVVGGVGGAIGMGVPSLMAKGATLGGRVALGAAEGAGYGAAQGFAEGEGGFANRIASAGDGTLKGAGVGAAFPVIASGVGAGVRVARNMMAETPEALQGYSRGAVQRVGRAIGDDARAGFDNDAALARMTPEGMLLDLPGMNVRTQVEGLVARPGGEASSRIVRSLNERAAGAADRISGAADNALGTTQGLAAERAALRASREANASPLYEAARQYPRPLDAGQAVSLIDEMMLTATGKVRSALADIRGQLFNGEIPKSSAEALHNVRSEIGRGMRNEWRDVAGALKPVQQALDGQLDTIPGYAQARATWADSKATEEALDAGAQAWRPGTRRDDIAASLTGYSDAQRQAFTLGARDSARETMDNAGRSLRQVGEDADTIRGAMQVFGSRAGQDKLGMLARTPEAGEAAIQRLQAEAAMANRANEIIGNSRTAARQEALREFPAPGGATSSRQLAPATTTGLILAGLDYAARKVTGGAIDRYRGQIADDAARIYTQTGDARQAIAQALMRVAERQGVTRRQGEAVQRVAQAILSGRAAGVIGPEIDTGQYSLKPVGAR